QAVALVETRGVETKAAIEEIRGKWLDSDVWISDETRNVDDACRRTLGPPRESPARSSTNTRCVVTNSTAGADASSLDSRSAWACNSSRGLNRARRWAVSTKILRTTCRRTRIRDSRRIWK